MLRFLLDKFRQAPGPLKQTRLIVGDLAEEIIDLASYYVYRKKNALHEVKAEEPPRQARSTSEPQVTEPLCAPDAPLSKKSKLRKAPKELHRTIDAPEELARALDKERNKRTQEFKVLATLWDADRRNLPPLSAKELSSHGAKLGVVIRHENVRKVIRMRLDKQVEIRTEQSGNRSIYKYRISPSGIQYFAERYL